MAQESDETAVRTRVVAAAMGGIEVTNGRIGTRDSIGMVVGTGGRDGRGAHTEGRDCR
jgi:hypothetical protein